MTMRRLLWTAGFGLLLSAASAGAQTASCSGFTVTRSAPSASPFCVGAPVAGFVFSPSDGQIHPILGVPGSMHLSSPLQLGFTMNAAQIAPRQDYAVVRSAADNTILMLEFRGRTVYVRDTGLPAGASRVALSSSGESAVVSYEDSRLVVLSNLPRAPQMWTADASSIPGRILSVAVSDDGARVLAGTDTGQVYSVAKSSKPNVVAAITSPGASGFLRGGHDAVIADSNESKLYYFSDSAGALWPVAAIDRSAVPSDMAVSSDNTRVFLVGSGSDRILSVDLGSGATTSTACNCVPSGLSPLSSDTFRLTDSPDSSLLLFRPGASPDESFLFLPRLPDPDPAPAASRSDSPSSTPEAPRTAAAPEAASRDSAPQPAPFQGIAQPLQADAAADDSKPAAGRLTVTAAAPGGRLFIDGALKAALDAGKTFEVSSLTVGKHRLKLEPADADFEPAEQEVEIEAGGGIAVTLTAKRIRPGADDAGPERDAKKASARKAMTATLKPGERLDLETGDKTGTDADIRWIVVKEAAKEEEPPTRRLEGEPDVRFAPLKSREDIEAVSVETLLELEYRDEAPGTEAMPIVKDSAFAVRTREGRYAAVRIDAVAENLTLRWIVPEKPDMEKMEKMEKPEPQSPAMQEDAEAPRGLD